MTAHVATGKPRGRPLGSKTKPKPPAPLPPATTAELQTAIGHAAMYVRTVQERWQTAVEANPTVQAREVKLDALRRERWIDLLDTTEHLLVLVGGVGEWTPESWPTLQAAHDLAVRVFDYQRTREWPPMPIDWSFVKAINILVSSILDPPPEIRPERKIPLETLQDLREMAKPPRPTLSPATLVRMFSPEEFGTQSPFQGMDQRAAVLLADEALRGTREIDLPKYIVKPAVHPARPTKEPPLGMLLLVARDLCQDESEVEVRRRLVKVYKTVPKPAPEPEPEPAPEPDEPDEISRSLRVPAPVREAPGFTNQERAIGL